MTASVDESQLILGDDDRKRRRAKVAISPNDVMKFDVPNSMQSLNSSNMRGEGQRTSVVYGIQANVVKVTSGISTMVPFLSMGHGSQALRES